MNFSSNQIVEKQKMTCVPRGIFDRDDEGKDQIKRLLLLLFLPSDSMGDVDEDDCEKKNRLTRILTNEVVNHERDNQT